MESKTVEYLKALSSYSLPILNAMECDSLQETKKIDFGRLQEAVTELKAIESRIKHLLKQLGVVGKTSKSIRQQCGLLKSHRGASTSTFEDEAAEFSRSTSANMEISEPFHEIPVESTKERKCFRVLVDTTNFSQKDVDVKILKNRVVVRAEHGMKPDEHGIVSRKFTREFEIPEDVDIESFRSLVDCYGVLIIEASYKPEDVKNETPVLLVDPYRKTSFQPYENLGEEFRELANRHIKDATEMKDFARKLAKQRPSDYIPMEEVI